MRDEPRWCEGEESKKKRGGKEPSGSQSKAAKRFALVAMALSAPFT